MRQKLIGLILLVALAFGLPLVGAQTITTTTTDSVNGVQTETKPLSTATEYTRAASLSTTFTATGTAALTSFPPPLSIPSLGDIIEQLRGRFGPLLLIFNWIWGKISRFRKNRQIRKESEREKERPQDGVEFTPLYAGP